jgi:hypothetical protein
MGAGASLQRNQAVIKASQKFQNTRSWQFLAKNHHAIA